MGIRVTNNFDPRVVRRKVKAAIGLFAHTSSKKMEAHAKRNAPWKDRSSNARNSIKGTIKWDGDKCIIRLSGNMNYSQHLELAHEKKYAILYPTIRKFTPQILRGYKKLVSK